jgi:hypothetical protein
MRQTRAATSIFFSLACGWRPATASTVLLLYADGDRLALQVGVRRCHGGDVAAASSPLERLAFVRPTPEILQATPNILDRDGNGPPYTLSTHCLVEVCGESIP